MNRSLQQRFSSPQYRLIEAGGCAGPEKQVCQSGFAKYPAYFPQGEKGQQGAKIHLACGQHFGYASVAERRKGTRQTLSVPHSLNRVFQNMEHRHQQREDERFVDGGMDQRPVFLPFANPQILADQNDLRQDQGVDQGSSVLEAPLAKPALEQHAVGGKGGEQGREEEENRQILAEFMDRFLFEAGLVHWCSLCLS